MYTTKQVVDAGFQKDFIFITSHEKQEGSSRKLRALEGNPCL
jgi:hypothetical protein